jgi:hypothetical protein
VDQFINLLDTPYSRRGSYMSFANDNNGVNVRGKSSPWLCNSRSLGYAMTSMASPNNYRQVLLQPISQGLPAAAFINTTPYEVILETAQGSLRFCLGEKKLMMAYGTDGLTLRVTPPPLRFPGPTSIPLLDAAGRRMIEFNMTNLVITPIAGTIKAGPMFLDILPDENGVLQVAFDDCPFDPDLRPVGDYPSYEACVSSVREDFDSFCAEIMPELPAPYEEKRLQALWQTWNMMVGPDDENDYHRPMVKMIHCIFEQAFAWQMPMQAICLHRAPKLAWDLLCSCFEYQDAHGRLSDAVPYKDVPGRPAMKPPVQGAALLWLMDNGVFDAAAPSEAERNWLLERMIKATDFYFNFRDCDHDGLCEYDHALETGWEDAPQYRLGMPQAAPDLNALLALQLEAIARLGALCGMPAVEQAAYTERSRALIRQLIAAFWDGEQWHSVNVETQARSQNDNISFYMALLLGRRLPAEVVEKSVARLFRPGGFDSPIGLTSEPMDAPTFRGGFSAGSVITPAQFFLCLALEACGCRDKAQRVANRYCAALRAHGFFHIYNALSGREDRSLTACGERGLFWSAWTSSCYLFLADRYGRA